MQKTISCLALLAAIAALAVSVHARVVAVPPVDEAKVAEQVYARMVSDVYAELKPVYEDFEIDMPNEPETLREALHPLIGISQPIGFGE